jgi:hypothetical protein
MSLLGSRNHYCIHPVVSQSATKNEDCHALKDCPFDLNLSKASRASADPWRFGAR